MSRRNHPTASLNGCVQPRSARCGERDWEHVLQGNSSHGVTLIFNLFRHNLEYGVEAPAQDSGRRAQSERKGRICRIQAVLFRSDEDSKQNSFIQTDKNESTYITKRALARESTLLLHHHLLPLLRLRTPSIYVYTSVQCRRV